MPLCTVFAFTGASSKRAFFPVEIGLTTTLIFIAFAQLYSGTIPFI
jgi:hypothetical protein